MLGREHHVSRTIERVWPRGKDMDFLLVVDLELDLRAFASTDPVALQQFDSLRPIESVEFIEQALRISGDAQHPLPHRSLKDWETADVAFSVDHLFVGQNGSKFRTPIHRDLGHIGKSCSIRILAAVSRDRLGLVRLRIKP